MVMVMMLVLMVMMLVLVMLVLMVMMMLVMMMVDGISAEAISAEAISLCVTNRRGSAVQRCKTAASWHISCTNDEVCADETDLPEAVTKGVGDNETATGSQLGMAQSCTQDVLPPTDVPNCSQNLALT
ncbi:hypothetical protein VOLCADRAFT_88726 [Volvox carteri f. nagariensis]|uniref:Uncharacterized protein n=1 Tax=Volvox carteri f. nagariensis TaxID=3068 RepID=D8TPS9_VOLCA|nr:uncharacterized protein VOLCADRAFT_88726 [Volvox carteri f. nagariensis]EFJ50285.1 hypothetical protein VOLCADRAFT_88726 [Volvox carteri f. nagariensis]|eukprot:XP_002948410.1 hypothetical protein VOLCADRAFT_88726 [Volvox carteri f. nagariensis]